MVVEIGSQPAGRRLPKAGAEDEEIGRDAAIAAWVRARAREVWRCSPLVPEACPPHSSPLQVTKESNDLKKRGKHPLLADLPTTTVYCLTCNELCGSTEETTSMDLPVDAHARQRQAKVWSVPGAATSLSAFISAVKLP